MQTVVTLLMETSVFCLYLE